MDWAKIKQNFLDVFNEWEDQPDEVAIDKAFEVITPMVEDERITTINVVGPATVNHSGDLTVNSQPPHVKLDRLKVTMDATTLEQRQALTEGPFKLDELNKEWARLQKEGLAPAVLRQCEKYRLDPIVYVKGGPCEWPPVLDPRTREQRKPFVSDIPLPKDAAIVRLTRPEDPQVAVEKQLAAIDQVEQIKSSLIKTLGAVADIGSTHARGSLKSIPDLIDDLIKLRIKEELGG